MGVAGAVTDSRTVLITGVAGLLAGALSMAAGEFVSVTSQRELFEKQLAAEDKALATRPKDELDTLARIYHRRGVPLDIACRISKALSADLKTALETHAREHLGLNPDDLGSPLGAAASSFVSFAIGALVPLVSFLLHAGANAFAIAGGAGIVAYLIGKALGVSL